MARLPIDDYAGNSIQAIELRDDVVTLTVSGSSSAYALPSSSEVVRVAVSVDSYIRFGMSGVTVSSSNGHYFPKGVEVLVVPREPSATHLAVIAAGSAGVGTLTSAR